ncbi:fumarylacetoacetate hydrolase family protein [Alicyclobacillus dauci]|uniref:Fumarylacetoacetate hydrolase family protein n=1 Tax=Alicyclobacillus dauci TaxID=1475485 RepID=A0ABY6Z1G9_9BACL|nr:fumarylacetoacetate hydrolase family protein [Alicyclobacillus dauci]WAH36732.1 fumarylacetoacetate hydrolase family protein [Alicyclobacillus dauci]
MKTIRYSNPADNRVELGILHGDDVFSVTHQVPSWTDPVPMWHALRALGITAAEAEAQLSTGPCLSFADLERQGRLLPPVVSPEVWASGVTYERSREARNAETQIKDSVYDRVYVAERPELFFKATYDRVVAPGHPVALRSDSQWMVPEPELCIVISAAGDLIGWTVGNDLSSRDIEGENPLYLPQAKVFARSCSFGPVLLWNTGEQRPEEWDIELTIARDGVIAFQGSVSFSQFRRSFATLIEYLRRDNPIQDGTVLMTGTGIVPPDEFTLANGDVVEIFIDAVGMLRNPVEAQVMSRSVEV